MIGRMKPNEHNEAQVRRLLEPLWEVTGPVDREAFVRNLYLVFPEGTMLVVEGTKIPETPQAFLESNQPPDCPTIALDTEWPTPKVFHLPVTQELMERLATFALIDDRWELCDHLKAYRAYQEVMAWYDADCNDPWFADGTVKEENLKDFCRITGSQYKKYERRG